MKNKSFIKGLKLIIACLIINFPGTAQNSFVINIDGYKFGHVQWQQSLNGTLWSDIKDSVNTSLVIDDAIPAFYKAKVSDGTCTPWFSTVYISGSVKVPMILVPGGTFMMGTTSQLDPKAYSNEMPMHQVSVDSFYISRYEITNIQYAKFLNEKRIGANGLDTTAEFGPQTLVTTHKWSLQYVNGNWQPFTGYELFPVVNVTWYGANEYCTWAGGRLLTEAEWEFAARGGLQTKSYLYSGSNLIGNVGWYSSNSAGQTKMIGGKASNELGINDMSGNVWEWCADFYQADLTSGVQNPTTYKVFRGGSCYTLAPLTRNTLRYYGDPANYYNSLGFRLRTSITK